MDLVDLWTRWASSCASSEKDEKHQGDAKDYNTRHCATSSNGSRGDLPVIECEHLDEMREGRRLLLGDVRRKGDGGLGRGAAG